MCENCGGNSHDPLGLDKVLVDVKLCYEEGLIEVHTVGSMLELNIEDAEALGNKLLSLVQDYNLGKTGVCLGVDRTEEITTKIITPFEPVFMPDDEITSQR